MSKIYIENVQNGWILNSEEEISDQNGIIKKRTVKQVFSYDEEKDGDNLIALQELYYAINDLVGAPYNKWKVKNLIFKIEKRRKD